MGLFLDLNTLFWRLATFAFTTIIATTGLNFSVRNGKRCDPSVEPPKQNIQLFYPTFLRQGEFFTNGLQIS